MHATLRDLRSQMQRHRDRRMHMPRSCACALQVEGIIFGVERDELRGPPAVLTSTYVVLWDVDGKNRRGKQPLAVSCWQ
jgi:G:T-mismatch repair DNA endonuclease (very short patch repair protein)